MLRRHDVVRFRWRLWFFCDLKKYLSHFYIRKGIYWSYYNKISVQYFQNKVNSDGLHDEIDEELDKRSTLTLKAYKKTDYPTKTFMKNA